MPSPTQRESLASLKARVRGLEQGAGGVARGAVLPFGLGALDAVLPRGGLVKGALHEVAGVAGDEEDGAVPAAFLAAIVGRLASPGAGAVLWCHGADDLYGPGLAAFGLKPDRLVLAKGGGDKDVLWAVGEALRAPGLAAVVGEVGVVPMTVSRRLALAAESAGVTAFLLRRWRIAESAARQRGLPLAAATRWRVAALPGLVAPGAPGVGRPLWRVELWRCRGGVPATVILEAPDAQGRLALPAELGHRPARPHERAPGQRRLAG